MGQSERAREIERENKKGIKEKIGTLAKKRRQRRWWNHTLRHVAPAKRAARTKTKSDASFRIPNEF